MKILWISSVIFIEIHCVHSLSVAPVIHIWQEKCILRIIMNLSYPFNVPGLHINVHLPFYSYCLPLPQPIIINPFLHQPSCLNPNSTINYPPPLSKYTKITPIMLFLYSCPIILLSTSSSLISSYYPHCPLH